MFISKKDLGDLKSKAGATSVLQSQLAKLTNELKDIKNEIDLEPPLTATESSMFGISIASTLLRSYFRSRTIKNVIKSIESRLDHQEKMQKMLFDHLGIEYAKITEETKGGRQEKEVLRKIKTIKK